MTRQKALAYVTRLRGTTTEVLVFDHRDFPDAGVQVPAGSIDIGESPAAAAVRETLEEVGIQVSPDVRFVGTYTYFLELRQEMHERHVYHLTPAAPTLDRWEHIVSGGVDDKGMVFICYWLDVETAAQVLSADQGAYLRDLT